MIGQIRGKLIEKKPPMLLVDTGGIAYEVEVPMSTLYELPDTGAEITLKTQLVVRDDAHILFGFASDSERSLFRNLIKVSGVGAKMALGILSGTSVEGFVRCVREENADALVKIPGIGKKTADRLLVEMRDRLTGIGVESGGVEIPAGSAADEAFTALIALGYRPAEVTKMIAKADNEDLTTEQLIREVLRQTVR